jgi:ribose/xylose/arabinose/galactoside ABC-type transport system permease subunit
MIQSSSTGPGIAGNTLAAPQSVRGLAQSLIWKNRGFFSSLVFFLLMIAAFTIFSPGVFLHSSVYTAVFVSLPIFLMLTTGLVFVIVAGEIDLAFPSTVGMCAFVFSGCVSNGWSPFLGLLSAVITGLIIGLINGILVTYVKLSSLVATLGMQFLLVGIINVLSNGNGITLDALSSTSFYNIFVGTVGTFPAQMLWGIAFAALALYLFSRNRFGARVCCVGDNAEAAKAMGIDARRVKIQTFMFMGFASSLAGVLAVLIDNSFYPTTGQGYLLTIIAAVFIGGTPTWGGVGTIAGAICGACTVGFIETGLIAVGLSGFWTNLFYGLVVILSLILHRFNRTRGRNG